MEIGAGCAVGAGRSPGRGRRAASQRHALRAQRGRRAHDHSCRRGDRIGRIRHGGGRRALAQDSAGRARGHRRRLRDRREHDDRSRRHRRHRDRGRRQARQPDPDRAQLRHRRAYGHCRLRGHRRQHAHRPQLQDRRRGDDLRPPADRRQYGGFRKHRRVPLDRQGGRLHRRLSGTAASRMAACDVGNAAACARWRRASTRSSGRRGTRTGATGRTAYEHDAADFAAALAASPHRYSRVLVDRMLEHEPGKLRSRAQERHRQRDRSSRGISPTIR